MHKSKTNIASEHSPRYLTTLCRHFSRKVPAKWDDEKGQVEFPMGECHMALSEGRQSLEIECSAESEQSLKTVELILEKHIEMFSRRERLSIDWSRVS
ncbi:DUF2218 domain-containing protein [Vibrio sp. HN007]|uniref:DUF2218 domain-containing protein n=1 Tax=Vibrio iocasae TaxID=3098914 RepID=UPI0035D49396